MIQPSPLLSGFGPALLNEATDSCAVATGFMAGSLLNVIV
jgi:hypothetical protein